MADKRQHLRIPIAEKVKLMHPEGGALIVKMRDMSDGGVYLITGDQLDLPVGTQVSIQAQDMQDAPLVKATIVRVEADGIALMFCEPSD